jgi:hypothetical protein
MDASAKAWETFLTTLCQSLGVGMQLWMSSNLAPANVHIIRKLRDALGIAKGGSTVDDEPSRASDRAITT